MRDDQSVSVIAEIGINHGGCLSAAKNLAELAVASGADVIKSQIHIVSDEMSNEAKSLHVDYIGSSIYDLMDRSSLSLDDESRFKEFVEDELSAVYAATPFSRAAADWLQSLGLEFFKIGSGECNNYPLLSHIGSFGKSVILSTGMNTIESVRKALLALNLPPEKVILLHTTNAYPCPDSSARLGGVTQLQESFPDHSVGYSDHTIGVEACIGAAALGAVLVEKHFTDSFDRPGPDIPCSMDGPMCRNIKDSLVRMAAMRGGRKGLSQAESDVARFAFASVCSTDDIPAGGLLTTDNIWVRRPSGGDFSASDYESLLGKTVRRNVLANTQLAKEDLND